MRNETRKQINVPKKNIPFITDMLSFDSENFFSQSSQINSAKKPTIASNKKDAMNEQSILAMISINRSI